MDEEFNLEIYRQAWEAENARMQNAPPRHTEEDIAAMLTKKKQPGRTLPLWLGGVAASVVVLLGVAWLLWIHPATDHNGQSPMADVRPTAPATLPEEHLDPSIVSPSTSHIPSTPIVRPRPAASSPSQLLMAEMPNPAMTITDSIQLMPDILPDSHAMRNSDIRAVVVKPNEQLLSFKQNDDFHGVEKQGSPNIESISSNKHQSFIRSINMQLALSAGATFMPGNTLRPTFGLVVTAESKSIGAICSNTQGGLSVILPQQDKQVCVNFGYGFSYLPADPLAVRINFGAFLLFGDFDFGLRLNAEAVYKITDNLMLSAGYQFYLPGIVSGDSRHAAMFSVGYIID